MKITIISPTFGGTSGVGRHTKTLASKMLERGYEVDTITSLNTPVIPIKNLKNISWALAAASKEKKGEIIHAHNLPSMFPARFSNGCKILTLHGYYSEQIRLLHGTLFGQISSIFEKQILKWADIITCVSKISTKIYSDLGFKVKYIPNAVDYRKIKSIIRGVKRNPKKILYLGRLGKEKGYDLFQNLAKDGYFLKKGYLFQVVFDKPWEEAIKLLASATILVLPSRMEGLPTTILESFACGTPVVASNIGGVNELIENYDTGLLFDSENTQKLKQAVYTVLNDKEIWRRLAKNGEKKVSKEYDWQKVASQYEEIYKKPDNTIITKRKELIS